MTKRARNNKRDVAVNCRPCLCLRTPDECTLTYKGRKISWHLSWDDVRAETKPCRLPLPDERAALDSLLTSIFDTIASYSPAAARDLGITVAKRVRIPGRREKERHRISVEWVDGLRRLEFGIDMFYLLRLECRNGEWTALNEGGGVRNDDFYDDLLEALPFWTEMRTVEMRTQDGNARVKFGLRINK